MVHREFVMPLRDTILQKHHGDASLVHPFRGLDHRVAPQTSVASTGTEDDRRSRVVVATWGQNDHRWVRYVADIQQAFAVSIRRRDFLVSDRSRFVGDNSIGPKSDDRAVPPDGLYKLLLADSEFRREAVQGRNQNEIEQQFLKARHIVPVRRS